MPCIFVNMDKTVGSIILSLVIMLPFFIFGQDAELDEINLNELSGIKKAEALIRLAEETLTSDAPKSFQYAEEALSLVESENSQPFMQAQIHQLLQISNYNLNDYPAAIEHGGKAIGLFEKLKKTKEAADCFQRLGNIYREIGNYDLALANIGKALELHTQINDQPGICADNYYLGAAYLFKNDYETTLRYNLTALELMEKLTEPDLVLKAGILNLIGRSYEFQKEYDDALNYFQQVLGLLEEENFSETKAQTLHNIAMLYDKMGKQKEAFPYLEEALEIVQQTNNKIGIAYTCQNLGIVYFNDGKFTDAAEYFLLSLPLFLEMGIQFGLATVYDYLAKIYLAQNNLSAAENNIQNCLEIAEKIRMKGLLKESYLVLSEIQFKQQDYKNAYLNFKKSTAYIDSVYTEDKNKAITEMQTKYETEKKERENLFLKEENRFNDIIISKHKTQRNLLIMILLIILISLVIITNHSRQRARAYRKLEEADKVIKQQRDELEIMNRTRDRFFSLISHDLKNAFSSLKIGSSLLQKADEMDKPEIMMIAEEFSASVDNLNNTLENLLEWARIQIGRIHHEPVRIDLGRMIREAVEIQKGRISQKELHLSIAVDDETYIMADENMIFSVLHNLIANAVKFTEQGGKIEISARAEAEMIKIIVADNGIGIPADKIESLFKVDAIFSTPGTATEKGTGLGLVLCHEFIVKNGGRINIESEENSGTIVTLTLPRSEVINNPS